MPVFLHLPLIELLQKLNLEKHILHCALKKEMYIV